MGFKLSNYMRHNKQVKTTCFHISSGVKKAGERKLVMLEQNLLSTGNTVLLVEQPKNGRKPYTINLDRNFTLLKIKANPNDPVLFQTFFCATCASFVSIGRLFPATSQSHSDHNLAWLPSIDESAPGSPLNHIANWLANTPLNSERLAWLSQVAATTSTLNWVWVVNEVEYKSWIKYLTSFLDTLADNWLAALNGVDSPLVTSAAVWPVSNPRQFAFKWLEEV